MKRILLSTMIVISSLSLGGCERIYALLHKPGGEEQAILGNVVFNEYNPKVEQLQKYLRLLGYHIGRPDGKFGAGSRDAVAKFQADEGLEVTRFVDKATWASIQVYAASPFVKNDDIDGHAVQRALVHAGYDPGRIDGQMGAKTRTALAGFQRSKGLAPDGIIGLKTFQALMREVPKASVPAEGAIK